MAKYWSVTSFAALVLLCSLVGKVVEAQGYKGGPPPKNPPQVRPPPKKQMDPHFVLPPVIPSPQKPQYPRPPQNPQFPQNPQNPQVPQNPQNPQNPQVPQDPKQSSFSYDMGAKKPGYPPSQNPQYPQYPRPQNPQVPHPQNPQNPQVPQDPKQSSFSYDMGSKKPGYPPSQNPQYPRPQNPQGPHYPGPFVPGVPAPISEPKQYDQSYQTPKLPHQKPQTPVMPPPVKSCEVDRRVRVPCGVPGITANECDAIDCCFERDHCFFGTGVTVQCTKDGHFIVVVAREVTLPNIDLDTISLLGDGQSCTNVDSNSAFAIYYFGVTECGSAVMEEPGVIIYENRMTSSYEVGVGPLGAITRDSSYELLFQCRYIGTSVETLVVEVLPLDNPPLPVGAFGPLRVDMRLASGQCATKGCNEVDAAYTSYYMDSDYPVTKILRDAVYVEVRILDRTDPALVLTLGRCWATTSPNPHSLPQWDILIDGCPYRDDRYLSSLVPVGQSSGLEFPSHHRRFLFKMFTFVDPNSMEPLREHVYIHCSTAVCVAGQGASCEPQCYRRKRDTGAQEMVVEPKVVVSSGEVIMTAAAAAEE